MLVMFLSFILIILALMVVEYCFYILCRKAIIEIFNRSDEQSEVVPMRGIGYLFTGEFARLISDVEQLLREPMLSEGELLEMLARPTFFLCNQRVLSKIGLKEQLNLIKMLDVVLSKDVQNQDSQRNGILLLCDLSAKKTAFEKLRSILKLFPYDVPTLKRYSSFLAKCSQYKEVNAMNKTLLSLNASEVDYASFLLLRKRMGKIFIPQYFFKIFCFFEKKFKNRDDIFFVGTAYEAAFEASDNKLLVDLRKEIDDYLISIVNNTEQWTTSWLLTSLAIVAFKSNNEIDFKNLMKKKEAIPLNHVFEFDMEQRLYRILIDAGKIEALKEHLLNRPRANISEFEIDKYLSSLKH